MATSRLHSITPERPQKISIQLCRPCSHPREASMEISTGSIVLGCKSSGHFVWAHGNCCGGYVPAREGQGVAWHGHRGLREWNLKGPKSQQRARVGGSSLQRAPPLCPLGYPGIYCWFLNAFCTYCVLACTRG